MARRTPQIRNLCRRHHVKRLDVFGSAVNGDFRPDESDIDFLVEFDDSVEGQRFETRFQLNEELETLFGRPVDLVVDSAIQNPYFRDQVDQTREPIYEAQQSFVPFAQRKGTRASAAVLAGDARGRAERRIPSPSMGEG